jgi:aryl-alcohol dehydrogenase-like predicted oxidoreductase
MIRYNAAHRGAEKDIFPYMDRHNPAVISYTATRWRFLLRKPKTWNQERIPTAGMCYRFVLSNPAVDVCMTAPGNLKQLRENIAAFREGPLPPEDMKFMREFGDAVYAERNYIVPFEKKKKREHDAVNEQSNTNA